MDYACFVCCLSLCACVSDREIYTVQFKTRRISSLCVMRRSQLVMILIRLQSGLGFIPAVSNAAPNTFQLN